MKVYIDTLYHLALLVTLAFSLVQLSLLLIYLFRKHNKQAVKPIHWNDLPRVTIQLPVFNEVYVVDRLIDAIVKLQYPADKLDIQILDDSTDETTARIARKITAYRQAGYTLEHIRRPERTGFKAGALAYGLQSARGEFIAIFDADFVPEPDFLLRVLPHFHRPDTGVVQTRWLHLNEDYSLLTQLQAIGLNAHFLVEQNARYTGDFFLNFNGTAGIWRKAAITDAGGWQSDTLTEDLDLSYRAQLKGWKIVYRDDIGVPAELPVTMNAIKSQQYRWMKGPAECARKHLWNVLTTPGASVGKKIQACFHLMNSSLFVIILMMALLSIPVLYNNNGQSAGLQTAQSMQHLFLLASVVSVLFWGIPFFRHERARNRSNLAKPVAGRLLGWLRFLWLYPLFLAVMLGLSLHNSLAVLEGHLGIKTPFVRTPKFNVSTTHAWATNVYVRQAVSWLVFLEIGLALYFSLGVGIGIYRHDYTMLSFHALLATGFGLVASYSLIHAWSIRSTPVEPVVVPAV